MKKGSIVAVVVAAVLIIGGLVYWYSSMQGSSYSQPAASAPSPTPTVPTGSVPASSSVPTASMTATVTYADTGFSPATVTIAKGGTVTFKNTASDAVRVASNPHPIHTGYPTTGGCVESTFDSCSNIPPGGSWSFTFTFAGSWGYHNHLNPGEGGTVVVK